MIFAFSALEQKATFSNIPKLVAVSLDETVFLIL